MLPPSNALPMARLAVDVCHSQTGRWLPKISLTLFTTTAVPNSCGAFSEEASGVDFFLEAAEIDS